MPPVPPATPKPTRTRRRSDPSWRRSRAQRARRQPTMSGPAAATTFVPLQAEPPVATHLGPHGLDRGARAGAVSRVEMRLPSARVGPNESRSAGTGGRSPQARRGQPAAPASGNMAPRSRGSDRRGRAEGTAASRYSESAVGPRLDEIDRRPRRRRRFPLRSTPDEVRIRAPGTGRAAPRSARPCVFSSRVADARPWTCFERLIVCSAWQLASAMHSLNRSPARRLVELDFVVPGLIGPPRQPSRRARGRRCGGSSCWA